MVIITYIEVILAMGLLEFLKKDKNVRKVFGERELKIIEKQLLGINLTQSEKNRLSRDIRRKLEFIREISRFQDEFKLKKGTKIREIIEDVKDFILQSKYLSKVKRIVLFGSHAEKSVHFGSDIDLAVEFDLISQKEATEFRVFVSGRVSSRVDIQVYNILPKKIKDEIDSTGKVIYERE